MDSFENVIDVVVYCFRRKQDISAAAVEVLQKMFPNVTVPQPLDVFVPRWHADRYFLGSYSHSKIGAVESDFKGLFTASFCCILLVSMRICL